MSGRATSAAEEPPEGIRPAAKTQRPLAAGPSFAAVADARGPGNRFPTEHAIEVHDMKRSNQKGFALVMVMGVSILFMILGATTAYMVFKAQQMSSGQARYTTAMIAADASQDMAAQRISAYSDSGQTAIPDTTFTFGSYYSPVSAILLGTRLLPSNSSELAAAYNGIGTGAGSRGAAKYYRVLNQASKTGGSEVSRLAVLRRKLVGGE
jgi:hypothetical protein